MKPKNKTQVVRGAVANPYLDEYLKIKASQGFLSFGTARSQMVNKYSWAIPNQEAIEALVALSPIVELGAGTGYWASLIRDNGGKIIAFDGAPPGLLREENHFHPNTKQWFPIREGGPEVAAQYPDHTLLLCWPPYADPFAADALDYFMKAGGQRLVYIGEGDYGCTADDRFHATLRAFWEQDGYVDIPKWYGLHDSMMIYRRSP